MHIIMKIIFIQSRVIPLLLLLTSLIATTTIATSEKQNFWSNNNNRNQYVVIPPVKRIDTEQEFNFKSKSRNDKCENKDDILSIRGGDATATCKQYSIPPALASVLAGSIAGAIGVGVAFPLDKLKTKSQVSSSSSSGDTKNRKRKISPADIKNRGGGSAVSAVICVDKSSSNLQLVKSIWTTEGIPGFFGGVRTAMIGQALIKSIAFTCNTNMLKHLAHGSTLSPPFSSLLLAASVSGIITSFVVVPVERIKILMQAGKRNRNELDCLRMVLRTEGWIGLCSCGLGTTILREIPSYAIYFVLYGYSKQSKLSKILGNTVAPLVLGALSGCASWIPIYPIDVVKTLLQNTSEDDSDSNSNRKKGPWQVATKLYRQGGISIFFDGLKPKLMECAVKHAIVFWLYNLIMSFLLVDH